MFIQFDFQITSLVSAYEKPIPLQPMAQVVHSTQVGGIDCIDIMETITARTSTEQEKKLNAVNDKLQQHKH